MATQLEQLPDVARLSPVCIRILGGNPGKFTLQGTNTYLVGTGPKRLLIDTGEGKPSWVSNLKRVLNDEKATITTAVLTHWHPDHQGGLEDLIAFTPDVRIFKNQPDAGAVDATHGGSVTVLEIRDGDTFEVEGASLTAFHTPGHTTDHMVLVLKEEDAMFTGDNVLGHGTAVFEDLGTYLESLEAMRHLSQGRAYPGHGPVIANGPAKILEYIDHRRLREEQVVQTLHAARVDDLGAQIDLWSPLDLVKVIYADVPESLHAPAAGGVAQILRKLEKEGRVSHEGDKWRLTNNRSAM
jgi:endoribonuclease LACTB2